jgi:hypothetical protein
LKEDNGIAWRGPHLREQSAARSIPEQAAITPQIDSAAKPLPHLPENSGPASQESIEKANGPHRMHGYTVAPSGQELLKDPSAAVCRIDRGNVQIFFIVVGS